MNKSTHRGLQNIHESRFVILGSYIRGNNQNIESDAKKQRDKPYRSLAS